MKKEVGIFIRLAVFAGMVWGCAPANAIRPSPIELTGRDADRQEIDLTPAPYTYPTVTTGAPRITPIAPLSTVVTTTMNAVFDRNPYLYNACSVRPYSIRVTTDSSLNASTTLGETGYALDPSEGVSVRLFHSEQPQESISKILATKSKLPAGLRDLKDAQIVALYYQAAQEHEFFHACFDGRNSFSVSQLKEIGIDFSSLASDTEIHTIGFTLVDSFGNPISKGLEEGIVQLLPLINPNSTPNDPFFLTTRTLSVFPAHEALFRLIDDGHLYEEILEAKARGDVLRLYEIINKALQRKIYSTHITNLKTTPEEAYSIAISQGRAATTAFIGTLIANGNERDGVRATKKLRDYLNRIGGFEIQQK